MARKPTSDLRYTVNPAPKEPRTARNEVPCGTCHACCRNQHIILSDAELGRGYVARPTRRGNTGEVVWELAHQANGDCYYLGPGGCTIHERTPGRTPEQPPSACRSFDCRVWVGAFSGRNLEMVLMSPFDGDCVRSALALMGVVAKG
jgi:hypothetical protein